MKASRQGKFSSFLRLVSSASKLQKRSLRGASLLYKRGPKSTPLPSLSPSPNLIFQGNSSRMDSWDYFGDELVSRSLVDVLRTIMDDVRVMCFSCKLAVVWTVPYIVARRKLMLEALLQARRRKQNTQLLICAYILTRLRGSASAVACRHLPTDDETECQGPRGGVLPARKGGHKTKSVVKTCKEKGKGNKRRFERSASMESRHRMSPTSNFLYRIGVLTICLMYLTYL